MHPITPDLWDLGDTTVADLLDTDSGSWNVGLVKTLFWEEDNNFILQIPISQFDINDIRVWHMSKHGCYPHIF